MLDTYRTFMLGATAATLLAACAVVVDSDQTDLGNDSSDLTTTLTFAPDADAKVDAAAPANNFGTATDLAADTSPAREAFFRFTVSGVGGQIASAKLRCYVIDQTPDSPKIYATSNNWTETGITWNNRPAASGAALDDNGAVTVGTWIEYDVTRAIAGNGTYSFVLAGDSSDMMKCNSREAASNPPSLVVSYSNTTAGSTALIMYASWLSLSEFDSIVTGNLDSSDMIRYRLTDYPSGYNQAAMDHLAAIRQGVPGLKLGVSIAYYKNIVNNAALIKSQGFEFVEYNLESGFDGPNSDSSAQSNLDQIRQAANAVHAQGMTFRVTPGKPNSSSFLRTGLLDDVALAVDYYHVEAQSIQDVSDTTYADFTASIAKVVHNAKPSVLVTSQISPSQGAQAGETVQQTMRDAIDAAMARPSPGNTEGAGMWIGGSDVADAKSFFTWFHQNHP